MGVPGRDAARRPHREPEVFPQTASRASFRLDTLRATGLTFDEELKPNFEDVHFSAAYLLALPRPVAGLVADARYRYRIRVAGSSTMQHAYLDPRRYTTVLDRGYLDLIARARERAGDGSVPAWLQHLLLYDVTFYLRENDRLISRVRFPAELAAPFHERIGEVARALDPAVVAAHRGESFTTTYRDLLCTATAPSRGTRTRSRSPHPTPSGDSSRSPIATPARRPTSGSPWTAPSGRRPSPSDAGSSTTTGC